MALASSIMNPSKVTFLTKTSFIKVHPEPNIFNTVENSERDGNTRPPDLLLEKFVCRSGSNS